MSRVKKKPSTVKIQPSNENIEMYKAIDVEARFSRFPNTTTSYEPTSYAKNYNRSATRKISNDVFEMLEDIIQIISEKKSHLSNSTKVKQADTLIHMAQQLQSLKGNLSIYDTQAKPYIEQHGKDIKTYIKMCGSHIKFVMNEWLKVNYDNDDLQYDFIIRLMANIESILGLTRMIQLVEKNTQYNEQVPHVFHKGGLRKSRRSRKTRRLIRK